MVTRRPLITVFILCILLVACSGATAGAETAPLSDDEALGEGLFRQHCASCHSTVGDTVIVGPPLAGIGTTAETRVSGMDAHAYIEQSILDPSAYLNEGFQDLMPKTFGTVLTGEELDALVAFLLTLK
jgi:mono/diheme cytochrome c family protein